MTIDINVYRTGYSLGVGGVVMYADKVLLVSFAAGSNKGQWALPGGFVERGETIDVAVRREIMEEAGVDAEIQGLIGVRNRTMPDENSMYLIFLLSAPNDNTQPDGVEIAEARYFTPDEIQALAGLRTLSRMVITSVFEKRAALMTRRLHPDFSPDDFVLYL